MSGRPYDRSQANIPERDACARTFSPDGNAQVQTDGGMPVKYLRKNAAGDEEIVGQWFIEADDGDPNTYPPAEDRIIRGATGVAIYPVWPATASDVTWDLWAYTGLTPASPSNGRLAWVRLASGTLSGTTPVEWQKAVGGRDVTFQFKGAATNHVSIIAAAY